MMTKNQTTAPIPADDPQRTLAIARPDEDQSLPHVGIVDDTYTILLAGEDTAGRFCLIASMCLPVAGHHPIGTISRRHLPCSMARSSSRSAGSRRSPGPAQRSTSPPTPRISSGTSLQHRPGCYASARRRARMHSSSPLASASTPGRHRHRHSTRRLGPRSWPGPWNSRLTTGRNCSCPD